LLAQELHDVTAKQSQSFMGILHYIRYPNGGPRPTKPDEDVKKIHWAISFAMILITWGSAELAKRRRTLTAADWLVILGNCVIAMLLIVPMSHMHYYAMMLVPVAGLWLWSLSHRPGEALASRGMLTVLIAWGTLNAIPVLPGDFCLWLREIGLAT